MISTEEELVLNSEIFFKLSGAMDSNLTLIEKRYDVCVVPSSNGVIIKGEESAVSRCGELLRLLSDLIKQGQSVNKVMIERCADMLQGGNSDEILDMLKETVAVTSRGKKIVCKTFAQRNYVKAIKKNTLTFAIGPAGTGKTYLAVALAVSSFKRGETERIILIRPAIEAGEKLGFLPGDLQMKVDPYLRPLYDALEEMFGVDNYANLIEKGIIEIAPLAFMRGRTLHRSFIILDEAQNTTEEQMKMFLTRLGDGSKIVVTGDLTQIDLPGGAKSGLKQAVSILEGIDDVAVCKLTDKDVIRHELVQKIVKAYERVKNHDKTNPKNS